MKTKTEINQNLKEICLSLSEIKKTLYWYIEVPIRKQIELNVLEEVKKYFSNHFCKGEKDFAEICKECQMEREILRKKVTALLEGKK